MTVPGGLPERRPDQYAAVGGAAMLPAPQSQAFVGRVVVVSSTAPGTGVFVYSGTPGFGNPPVLAIVAPGVTQDPYGNPAAAVLNIGNLSAGHAGFNAAGELFFTDPTGATRITINPGIGTPAITVYNASGGVVCQYNSINPLIMSDALASAGIFTAVLSSVATQNGLWVYHDNGNGTQGNLVAAAVVAGGNNDPVFAQAMPNAGFWANRFGSLNPSNSPAIAETWHSLASNLLAPWVVDTPAPRYQYEAINGGRTRYAGFIKNTGGAYTAFTDIITGFPAAYGNTAQYWGLAFNFTTNAPQPFKINAGGFLQFTSNIAINNEIGLDGIVVPLD